MKKETVVRQNRCDNEMNLLLFGSFFLYFAMQLFIGEPTQQEGLVNKLNMLLYLVFVPGFLFRLGYCFGGISRIKEEAQGKKYLGRVALRAYLYFLVLSVGYGVYVSKLPFTYCVNQVITFMDIPAVSAIFFALALAAVLAVVFYNSLKKLSGNKKRMLIFALVLLLGVFLRTKGETYALIAAFFGADTQQAVPVVPYFAYFLFGMWMEEKKPGFQWKIAGVSAAVTALSLVLYRTPLQDLCRVTASVLPVYLIYALSEGLSDLTVRFYGLRFVTDTVELVFAAYAVVLTVCKNAGRLAGATPTKVLAAALCVIAAIYVVIILFWFFARLYERWNDYFEKKIKHKTAVYFLIYTIVFAFLLLLAFADFVKNGRTLLWRADGISQYYPKAVYFVECIQNLIKSLFSGNFELPMYDFRLGFGGEITYSLEPLYFLFALFGKDKVEFTYTLLILIRFYLSGVAFSIFCLYFKKDYVTTFLASCVYVFCGFSFFGGARHAMFMIPMILFPLLLIAIEEIIQGKRWYLCTILVAISLFSNYYFLYMNTVGMGIYFLVRFFCQKEKEKKTFLKFIQKGLVICTTYLLGVAMSCIVLVTTFGLYVGSNRSSETIIKTPSLFYYTKEWILRCFLCFPTTANSPGEWLKLGFLPIALIAVVFLFTQKGRKELKIFSVIALIMMMLPLSGFVLNGFSSVSNRWCYMISMLAAYIVADCLKDMCKMEKREKLICAVVIGIYGYLAFFGNYMTTQYVQRAFWCLALTYLGLLFCQENFPKFRYVGKQSLLILMTVSMVFVNAHTLYGTAKVVNEYTTPGQAQRKAEDSPMRAVAQVGDDSFYRVAAAKLEYATISSSMILNYNSISVFNSTINSVISEYLEVMGATSYSVTHLLGLSNRAFLTELAAVKYYAYYDEPTRTPPYGNEPILETELDGKKTTVCENRYAMPLGYTYDKAISREELESYDTLKRQEVLMQRVMLENLDAQGTDGIETTDKQLDYKVKEEGLYFDGNSITTQAPEGETKEDPDSRTMTVTFKSQPKSETYLILKNAVLPGDGSETRLNITFEAGGDTIVYNFRPDDDRYGTKQKDYVFNLGYHEEAITKCTIKFNRNAVVNFDSMELYSQPMTNLPKYADALRENVLENEKVDGNKVSGTISLDKDKYLVLSIPYQKGWTAYVDGEKTELLRANYMYMALPLSAGEHEISLEFEIPGVKYALIIMPSAFALFVVLLAVRRIRKLRAVKRQKQAKEE